MCSSGVIWRKGANKSSTNTWTLGACVVWSRELLSGHTAQWAWVSLCTWISSFSSENSWNPVRTPKLWHSAWQDEQYCFPITGRSSSIRRKASRVLSSSAQLLWYEELALWKTFLPQTREGGMIQALYWISCAPYFHCYCISSTSDFHTLDLAGWGLLYKTRSLYFSSASSLFTFSPTTTRMSGTQCIGGDSKPHLSLATYDGDFCISSSSHGNYSHTWKLGRQSVHVLSMWLSAYVCTSFFRKFYFTLQQLDE